VISLAGAVSKEESDGAVTPSLWLHLRTFVHDASTQ
jgi:hypothetical protein